MNASSGTISYDAIVDALSAFGENEDSVAAVVVHPKVYSDLRKLKDTTGQPVFVNPQNGARAQVLGLPMIVSRRAPVISGTPNTYVTLFVRRGALALWYNGTPSIETDKDIAADTVHRRGQRLLRGSPLLPPARGHRSRGGAARDQVAMGYYAIRRMRERLQGAGAPELPREGASTPEGPAEARPFPRASPPAASSSPTGTPPWRRCGTPRTRPFWE